MTKRNHPHTYYWNDDDDTMAYTDYWKKTSTTHYTSCTHDGATPLFTIDGRTFHAVNAAGAKTIHGCVAHIDLAGTFTKHYGNAFVDTQASTLTGIAALAALVNKTPGAALLRLDWPDFGTPPDTAGVTFWRTLVQTLPPGKIAVGCIGSHGRTGTFLAALRIVWYQESAPNAINWVRAHHCTKAVESTAQEIYLWRLATTMGTTTQPYDEALAARVNALGTSPKEKTASLPPPPTPLITLPTLSLSEVIYLKEDQTPCTVSVSEWMHPDYFSTQFRRHTRSESRVLIYR